MNFQNVAHTFENLSRTQDVQSSSSFENLGLDPTILTCLKQAGFHQPTSIQVESIPSLKSNHNLIIHAKSGTGKTLIFSIAAIMRYLKIRNKAEAGLISVIICPTREIAIQGYFTLFALASAYNQNLLKNSADGSNFGSNAKGENSAKYKKFHPDRLTISLAVGGNQESEGIIKSCSLGLAKILIGTPGKIKGLLEKNQISLTQLRILCFDECDKLFEMKNKYRSPVKTESNMKKQVNFILEKFNLPSRCQLVGLSATFDASLKSSLEGIIDEYLYIKSDESNDFEISGAAGDQNFSNSGLQNLSPTKSDLKISKLQGVLQYCINLPEKLPQSGLDLKIQTAHRICQICPYTQAIIFCSNRNRVETCLKYFEREKLKNHSQVIIQILTSTLSQGQREEALINLREHKAKITIASDLAARGIDASNVDLVIHLDGASDWQTHQHRTGRGGRFGSFAVSIAILVKKLRWDVELLKQLTENGIDLTELPFDDEQNQLLPLPKNLIDHILNSGRQIFNQPKREPVVKTELRSSLFQHPSQLCFTNLSLDELLEKFEAEYENGQTSKVGASIPSIPADFETNFLNVQNKFQQALSFLNRS